MKKTLRGKLLTVIACAALSVTIFMGTSSASMAYTQATGIISADAAKVRKEPTTSSDEVMGLLKGSTVTVTDEVTDSEGMRWYRITANGKEGYIRSDLMIKGSTPVTDQGTAVTPSNPGTTTGTTATVATPIAETKAYVNYASARVRQGASTNHEIVGSVTKNTPVTITGEAKGNDGKKWYQIKYKNSAGNEAAGFVRSDLLTLGDPPAPVEEAPAEEPEEPEESEALAEETGGSAEDGTASVEGENAEAGDTAEGETAPEEPVEAPVPEETAKPDYEMVFTANNEGVEEWYLYDNINGTRQTLQGLLTAAEAGSKQSEVDVEQLSTQKIIIIVLAVLVAILAIAVTLLLFRIKDMYGEDYEDYEDDEDDEEDEDEEDEEEEVRVVRRKRPADSSVKQVRTVSQEKEAPVKTRNVPVKRVEYDPEEDEFEAGRPVAEKPQPKRKAKNFLADDEFEFEFLNMDDKN